MQVFTVTLLLDLLPTVLLALGSLVLPILYTRIIRRILDVSGSFLLSTVVSFYVGLLVYGLLTVLCEWKQISLPAYQKLLYVFTFPVFMATYIPISLAALIQKVEWKPIYHTGGQKSLGKAA